MPNHFFHLKSVLSVAAAVLLLSACGDDEEGPVNPEFEDLQILCANDSTTDGVEGPVFKEIRVKVTDPNRDLVSVTGTLNAIPITLEDPDADLYFSWTPPADARPMSCVGEFTVDLDATDAAGNSTQYFEIVTK